METTYFAGPPESGANEGRADPGYGITVKKSPAKSGLQTPWKPLGFKGAITGRFARKDKAIRPEDLPTNLGVGGSNPFGRANEINDLADRDLPEK
jgi:hypothetical protein